MACPRSIAKWLSSGLVAAALLLSGCGDHAATRSGGNTTRAVRPTTTAPAAAQLPQPAVRCPGPNARAATLTFASRNGARLDGALLGSGPTGAVLLPEYPGSYCGWWSYAVDIARHGIHVLLFDYHCQGLSTCGSHRLDYMADAKAAAATLKRHGARSIALVGASLGGALALASAATLHPTAVIDLSGEPNPARIIPGVHLAAARFAPRVRAPALFAVAHGDHYVSVMAMRAVDRETSSAEKTLSVLARSAGHGWEMLTDSDGRFTQLAAQIIAFVKAHHRSHEARLAIHRCRPAKFWPNGTTES